MCVYIYIYIYIGCVYIYIYIYISKDHPRQGVPAGAGILRCGAPGHNLMYYNMIQYNVHDNTATTTTTTATTTTTNNNSNDDCNQGVSNESDLFDFYTENATRAVMLAESEARNLQHAEVGTIGVSLYASNVVLGVDPVW